MTTTRNRPTGRRHNREPQAPAFIAKQVTERGRNSYWTRIGAAWKHQNGEGITIQLDSLPLDGRIILMPPRAEDAGEDGDDQPGGDT